MRVPWRRRKPKVLTRSGAPHRYQEIIHDLQLAADMLEIYYKGKVRSGTPARLRRHAQTLWEEEP